MRADIGPILENENSLTSTEIHFDLLLHNDEPLTETTLIVSFERLQMLIFWLLCTESVLQYSCYITLTIPWNSALAMCNAALKYTVNQLQ